jgi:hypothetical protein
VASTFQNTCADGEAADSVAALKGENISCSGNYGMCVNSGHESGSTCTFTRKLCVSCSMNHITRNVRVRVQSNGLPAHCYASPVVTPIEQDIDYSALFNPAVNVSNPSSTNTPVTQDAVSTLVCDITRHKDVPATSAFHQSGASTLQTSFGTALDGVSLFNAMSADAADPFYPAVYNTSSGEVKGSTNAEKIDACLEHPQATGIFHYHSMPPCVLNETIDGSEPSSGLDFKSWMLNGFSPSDGLVVMGIAKDGHLVYGPYQKDGTKVEAGFDVCGGVWFDEDGDGVEETYAYFATDTFPYYSGCFGPGSFPDFVPQCTTNPPAGYVKTWQQQPQTNASVPTPRPTNEPSLAPAVAPTHAPTHHPTPVPIHAPTPHPTPEPTPESPAPTPQPTHQACSQSALCNSYAHAGASCVAGCYEWCEDYDSCMADASLDSYCRYEGACHQYVFSGVPAFVDGCGVDDTYTEAYTPTFQAMCGWSAVATWWWPLALIIDDLCADPNDHFCCAAGTACSDALQDAIVAIDAGWAAWLTAENIGRQDVRRSLLSTSAANSSATLRVILSANMAASPYIHGSQDAEMLDAVQGAVSSAVADGSLAASLQASGVDVLSSAAPITATFGSAMLIFDTVLVPNPTAMPIVTPDDPSDGNVTIEEACEICHAICESDDDFVNKTSRCAQCATFCSWDDNVEGNDSLGAGAIAGIVCGVIVGAGLAVAGAAYYYLYGVPCKPESGNFQKWVEHRAAYADKEWESDDTDSGRRQTEEVQMEDIFRKETGKEGTVV